MWPYLSRLSASGIRFIIITWEPALGYRQLWYAADEARIRREVVQAGGRWIGLRRRLVLWDLLCIWIVTFWVAVRGRARVLHARSDVAMAVAWSVAGCLGLRTVYDMRGFWADERLDGGLWREGLRDRAIRALEGRWIRDADAVVVLTQAAADRIAHQCPRGPVHVIPTCVDLQRFVPAQSRVPGVPKSWMVAYSGSLGTWQSVEELGDLFRAVCRRSPGSRLVVLTPAPPEQWYPQLVARGVDGNCIVAEVNPSPETIAARIADATVGVALYHRPRSAAGCCPIKVGEYLACGLPVVVSAGIGDCNSWIPERRVGVIVSSMWEGVVEQLEKLLEDPELSHRCRMAARELFDVADGARSYQQVYQQLGGCPQATVEPVRLTSGAQSVTSQGRGVR